MVGAEIVGLGQSDEDGLVGVCGAATHSLNLTRANMMSFSAYVTLGAYTELRRLASDDAVCADHLAHGADRAMRPSSNVMGCAAISMLLMSTEDEP